MIGVATLGKRASTSNKYPQDLSCRWTRSHYVFAQNVCKGLTNW